MIKILYIVYWVNFYFIIKLLIGKKRKKFNAYFPSKHKEYPNKDDLPSFTLQKSIKQHTYLVIRKLS